MCGIAGIYNINTKRGLQARELEKLVTHLLLGIESRGKDATGIASIKGNGLVSVEKADIPASNFTKWRSSLPKRPKTILLHTRFATQGVPEILENNHPVVYNNATIVHNGHIRNDDELFESEKLDRIAQVDSEIIAGLFDKYGIEKAHMPLQKLEGSFAVAAIDERNPTALVLAKGQGSPLSIYQHEDFIMWASESRVIEAACEDVLNLKCDWKDMEYVKAGDLFYIEHGRLQKYEFKPKITVYTPYSPSTTTVVRKPHRVIHGVGHNGGQQWNGDSCATGSGDDDYGWLANDYMPPELRALPKVTTPSIKKKLGEYIIRRGTEAITIRACEECDTRTNKKEMEEIAGFWYCKECVEGPKPSELIRPDVLQLDEREEEDMVLTRFEENEIIDPEENEELQMEHFGVCEKIGAKFGLTADSVDHILYGIEDLIDGHVTNTALVKLYEELENEYSQEYEKIIELEALQNSAS